jgi:hypothetical protein
MTRSKNENALGRNTDKKNNKGRKGKDMNILPWSK